MKTTREDTHPRKHRPKRWKGTLQELVIDIVRDDPEDSDVKLRARAIRQVRDDEDLLEEALTNHIQHLINIARSQLEREKKSKEEGQDPRKRSRENIAGLLEAATTFCTSLGDWRAENGKQFLKLTKEDCISLAADNNKRSFVYRELAKLLQPGQTIGQAMADSNQFRLTVLRRIGGEQAADLAKLFGS